MTDLAPLHITVPRTARYYMLGTPGPLVRDLWIVCHGYGQLAADFAELFRALTDDTRMILIPEALSRFYTDMTLPHTPTSKIGATWMTREDREADIADIVAYLQALCDRAVSLLAPHGIGRETIAVHALGFSQGGHAATRWAAFGATRVDHLVMWGTVVPPDVDLRAMRQRVRHWDFVYGTSDPFITAKVAAAQEAVLTAAGVPYRVRPFPGGHTLSGRVLHELMEGG